MLQNEFILLIIHYFRRVLFPAERLLKYSLRLPACNSDRSAEFIFMKSYSLPVLRKNVAKFLNFKLNRKILNTTLPNANLHFRLMSRLLR